MQVTLNFNAGVKVPGELIGNARFSNHEFGASISITESVPEEVDPTAAIEEQLANLANQVKTFLYNQAGIDQMVNENGVILPVIVAEASVSIDGAAAQVVAFPTAVPTQAAAPVVSGSPQWEGRPIRIFDNRQEVLTAVPGSQESKRPHLKIKFMDVGDSAPYNVKYKGFYPTNKDGSPNQGYQQVLAMLQGQQAQSGEGPF